MTCKFFLGTHHPEWLNWMRVPLFVSRRRIFRKDRAPRFPVAVHEWALDSGGFSELDLAGKWSLTPEAFVEQVQRIHRRVGKMAWSPVMDWMCEERVLKKTGLSIREHQRRTVRSYRNLMDLDPTLPWAPVLQGFALKDYLYCADLYDKASLNLSQAPVVGVGSICRRQHTEEATGIIRGLSVLGLRLHAFGFKIQGLAKTADCLVSADSMSWSYSGRREPPLDGCIGHKNCANCPRYALLWRQRALAAIERGTPSTPMKEET